MPPFKNTLVLPIDPARWAPPRAPVTVDGIVLAPKPELHVTLIGSALGRELRAAFGAGWLDAAVGAAFQASDWRFTRTGRCWLLRRRYGAADMPRAGGGNSGSRVAHSIIERIDLPAMAPFHHALGRLLGRQLPVPPPHVTLYVADRPRGIGVASRAMLRAVEVGEVSGLFQP